MAIPEGIKNLSQSGPVAIHGHSATSQTTALLCRILNSTGTSWDPGLPRRDLTAGRLIAKHFSLVPLLCSTAVEGGINITLCKWRLCPDLARYKPAAEQHRGTHATGAEGLTRSRIR